MEPYTRNGGIIGKSLNYGTSVGPVASTVSPSQQLFTALGAQSWTVPTGVTTISAVLVGGGGAGNVGGTYNAGGGGGGLRYINNLPVTPGETLTVFVGSGGTPLANNTKYDGTASYIARGASVLVQANGGIGAAASSIAPSAGGGGTLVGPGPAGGNVGGSNGGNGGVGSSVYAAGGGGAGGYAGNGGTGGTSAGASTAGTGGGGGGGGSAGGNQGGQGGGVGLLGQGTNGTAVSYSSGEGLTGGAGSGGSGSLYGGGGGGYDASFVAGVSRGAQGAVRIIWGISRTFPSTNTADNAGTAIPVYSRKNNSGIWDLPTTSSAARISGNNIFPWPTDIFAWTGSSGINCTVSRDTTTPSPFNNTSLKMVVSGADPYAFTVNSSAWSLTTAAIGQTWELSVWIMSNAATTSELLILEAASTHAFIGTAITQSTVTVGTQWRQYKVRRTLTDATTAYLQIRLDGPNANGTGANLWFDGLQLRRIV